MFTHTHTYAQFDFSYDQNTTQDEIYQDLAKPIVDKAFMGYNGTIFAYAVFEPRSASI